MKEETLFVFELDQSVFADGEKEIPAGTVVVKMRHDCWSISEPLKKIRSEFGASGVKIKVKSVQRIDGRLIT